MQQQTRVDEKTGSVEAGLGAATRPAEAPILSASSIVVPTQDRRRTLRASFALFLAGFATFSLLYCPQPLLPTLSRAFGVSAASSSLAISLSTGVLALSIILAAAVSDRVGRKPVMALSLVAAAALNTAAAAAPSWPLFLTLRALEGAALGGVPAVAMTYLAEETPSGSLGLAMGIYVGSTAVGGMAGRVITGVAAAALSWRSSIAIIGGVGLAAALGFLLLLPAARHFRPRSIAIGPQLRAFKAAMRQPLLRAIYAFAFLSMGGFVAVYNYAGFRLEAAPYGLDAAQEGLIFTLYLLGTASSAAAGSLADRLGKGAVMTLASVVFLVGLAATLVTPLVGVVIGIALVTLGFFAGHAVASGSVGALAGPVKAQAASLYLLSYYAGSSLLGTAGGWFWAGGGWTALAGFVGALEGMALLIGLVVAASLPPARVQKPS